MAAEVRGYGEDVVAVAGTFPSCDPKAAGRLPNRPQAFAFDVIETLFSLEPIRARLVGDGLPAQALEWWFAQVLRDGFSLASLGRYEPFSRVAESALGSISARLGMQFAPGWAREVLEEMSSLPPHENAGRALRLAASSGARVVALTNGSAHVTGELLAGCDFDRYVEEVVSIEEVEAWKPLAAPYGRAADAAGVPAGRLALVAVHAWDAGGASAAGLVTGWCSRLERDLVPWVRPDVVGGSLTEVVEGLLALPER